MKLGIVGNGYVGKAIYHGFKDNIPVATYDKYQDSTFDNIEELCHYAEIIFVCVPTPMDNSGNCDTSIVESVVSEIDKICNNNIVVIKSTVPPGTTDSLAKKYLNIKIIFSPEFLTEANYLRDFQEADRVIFGGDYTDKVKRVFEKVYPEKQYIQTDSKTAEMVKYMTNTFLATKVSFSNEIYDICCKINVEYDKVVEYVTLDSRLGKSHWSVPGPDGKMGFGGTCFPKDINGLIRFAKTINVKPTILEAAWKKNLQVRPERDWEKLVGRAIIKE